MWPRVFEALQKAGAVDLLLYADRLSWAEQAPPPAAENAPPQQFAA
ncbi:hypothetical protein OGR47_01760 [Methylocystis sp. MJC1]|nr:hypothetical protein [Methylocystis sp. MJC1]UZX13832.1 hypothetical protein OGR47_01760 [Methylocystis sp. MJC1]